MSHTLRSADKDCFSPTMAQQTDDTYFQQLLNERPTVLELIEHVRVGIKWYTFGVLLKLDPIKLEEIKKMNEPTEYKALKMFELWVNTNPNATRREVIETLQKDTTGESTFAEEYVKVLKESE